MRSEENNTLWFVTSPGLLVVLGHLLSSHLKHYSHNFVAHRRACLIISSLQEKRLFSGFLAKVYYKNLIMNIFIAYSFLLRLVYDLKKWFVSLYINTGRFFWPRFRLFGTLVTEMSWRSSAAKFFDEKIGHSKIHFWEFFYWSGIVKFEKSSREWTIQGLFAFPVLLSAS